MAEKNRSQINFKKTYSNVSEWVKFYDIYRLIICYSSMGQKLAVPGLQLMKLRQKRTAKQRYQDYKEHLIQKGIIPPYTVIKYHVYVMSMQKSSP
jgi:hypothetical protein